MFVQLCRRWLLAPTAVCIAVFRLPIVCVAARQFQMKRWILPPLSKRFSGLLML
ncbi:hypothetical protein HanPSC8_Chr10g0412021 [Helianthus annuus]|nr:hypothetical protein HanPSC8_Chr10g0412021 [Helianthus annuus]